ncbi:DUF5789 family protein [Haladaptatus halobius]|jgi:hypothetical protein|uniref:DUF5789 family protein n=1 Tax=Haladaptatus halobius TaxID=2884875 RepID=UPI001D0B338E|nr:DUF2795 domain-containing protein [Haladaptatus halobius]
MTLKKADQLLDEHQYPTDTEQLIAAHGDYEIDLPNGTETLGDVFGRVGGETYESPQEAREAMYCGLSHKAIGRRHYSDRDPTTMGTVGPKQVSF